MSRGPKGEVRPPNSKGAAEEARAFQQRVERLEVLRQVEALLDAGRRCVMELGWADAENGRGVIVRLDGSEVAPTEQAIEAALDVLAPALAGISNELDAAEGIAQGIKRRRFRAEAAQTRPLSEPHPAESLSQCIEALVQQAVRAELDRRAQSKAKPRSPGGSTSP